MHKTRVRAPRMPGTHTNRHQYQYQYQYTGDRYLAFYLPYGMRAYRALGLVPLPPRTASDSC